jgi:hypothetical protein
MSNLDIVTALANLARCVLIQLALAGRQAAATDLTGWLPC